MGLYVMTLDDEQTRAAYYVAAEVIRSRQRLGQPVPAWLRKHYALLDTAVRVSPTRQAVAENGDCATQSAHGEIIGTREVAEMLGLTRRQVQRQAGQLGGARVCGRLLFPRADIADYARRGGR
jgi:hypothetical protein